MGRKGIEGRGENDLRRRQIGFIRGMKRKFQTKERVKGFARVHLGGPGGGGRGVLIGIIRYSTAA